MPGLHSEEGERVCTLSQTKKVCNQVKYTKNFSNNFLLNFNVCEIHAH